PLSTVQSRFRGHGAKTGQYEAEIKKLDDEIAAKTKDKAALDTEITEAETGMAQYAILSAQITAAEKTLAEAQANATLPLKDLSAKLLALPDVAGDAELKHIISLPHASAAQLIQTLTHMLGMRRTSRSMCNDALDTSEKKKKIQSLEDAIKRLTDEKQDKIKKHDDEIRAATTAKKTTPDSFENMLGLPVPNTIAASLTTLITEAADIIVEGKDTDDDVKKAREFMMSIKGPNAVTALRETIKLLKQRIAAVTGRKERLEKEARLRELEFDLLANGVDDTTLIQALQNATNNTGSISGVTVSAPDLFEYLAKKWGESKKRLCALLVSVSRITNDDLIRLIAKEKLVELFFEIVNLKTNPALFDGKTSDEIIQILYPKFYELLKKENAEFDDTHDQVLKDVAPLIMSIVKGLAEKGKKWEDIDTLDRLTMAAGTNTTVTKRIVARAAESYNPKAISLIGQACIDSGDYFGAMDRFDEALTLSEDLVETRIAKARLLLMAGKAPDAAALLKKVTEKEPENRAALELLREAYIQTGDLDLRADTDLKLAAIARKTAKQSKDEGRPYEAAGYEGRAEWYLRDAVSAEPRSANAVKKLAQFLVDTKRYAEAEAVIAKVVASSRDFLLLRNPRFRKGIEKKEEKRTGYIVTDEDRQGLVNELAKIYAATGREKEARSLLTKRYKFMPAASAGACLVLSKIYQAQGDRKKTLSYAEKAATLGEKDNDILEQLVDIYQALGTFDNITRAIELAEKLAAADTKKAAQWNKRIAELCIRRSTLVERGRFGRPKEKGLAFPKRQLDDLKKALEKAKDLAESERKAIQAAVEACATVIEAGIMSLFDANEKRIFARKKTKDAAWADTAQTMVDLDDMRLGLVSGAGITYYTGCIDRLKKLSDDIRATKELNDKIKPVLGKAYRLRAERATVIRKNAPIYSLPHTDEINDLKEALDLNPNDTASHYALAELYRDLNELEIAAQHMEKAANDATLEGKDRKVTRELINLYTLMGQHDKAV
ncbi:MAG: hypothetical protein PHT32_08405, partial [Candidatus Omnitrophica bacterium]|nr:hypothetical protein [Candidatus Omnitrophota bacterium]